MKRGRFPVSFEVFSGYSQSGVLTHRLLDYFGKLSGGQPLATHKSAEKRARQSVRRNKRNSETLGTVRTWEKKLRTALAGGDKTAAQTLLNTYMSKMTKAATKGVVHGKTAARKISRLAERVAELGAK
jgi:small subunit ribosomal protein S20